MRPEIDVHAVKISREDREDPMITRYSHPPFLKGCESISGRKYPQKVPVNTSGRFAPHYTRRPPAAQPIGGGIRRGVLAGGGSYE
jgi:hypothetical protein